MIVGPRVFVNAWLGAGNLGDELLFERLLERLRAHTVDEVTAVSLDPADTMRRHPGVNAVEPRSLSRTVRAIRQADLVIVGPGGIIQDDTSPWSLPYQLHRPLLARLMHTPTIGYGLGVGPLRRRSSGMILRAALGASASVVVRDEPSAALLGEHGIDATATADLVVASGSPVADPIDRMVVSLRPHRPGGAIVPVRWQRDDHADSMTTAIAAALDTAARARGLTTTFVAFEPRRDHPLHEAVASKMHTIAEAITPDTDTLLSEVARARVVVATRFHAGIAALVGRRPAVLVGYAPKVRSLAARIDGIYPIVEDTIAGFADLPAAIDQAMDVDDARVSDQLSQLRAIEQANSNALARALGGG